MTSSKIFCSWGVAVVITGRSSLMYVQDKFVQFGFLVEPHTNISSFNAMTLLDISWFHSFTGTGV